MAGTQVSATIPISERLLNEIITAQLPASAPVKEVQVQARAANTFVVRVRLARASFLPPITLTLTVIRQPVFPDDPELILQVAGGGLISLAGTAIGGLNIFPPGVRMEGDRVRVNVRTLLLQRDLGALLPFLQDLTVTTEERRVIVGLRAAVPLS